MMFTNAEKKVLQALAEGKTAPEIADLQFRSLGTIKKHIEHAKLKMGAKPRRI